MKKLLKGFVSLSAVKKLELVLATLFTLAAAVGAPALAWFSTGEQAEVLTKIKEPDHLDIRAGNYDPTINLDLRDIDVDKPDYEDNATHTASKYYVFSVNAGDYKIPYIIQVAHTTNIPFTYKLHRALKVGSEKTALGEGYTGYASYHPLDTPDEITYYAFQGTDLLTVTLNPDEDNRSRYGRILGIKGGNNEYYDKTYLSTDTPQIYAVPLYHQTEKIMWSQHVGAPTDHDYYVLELQWDTNADSNHAFAAWNKASNNKETDVIYISAAQVQGS